MFDLFENPSVDNLLQSREGQHFDRVSGKIDWRELGNLMIGFANAEGGVIAIGIEKDKTITGVEDFHLKGSEAKKAAAQWIKPALRVQVKQIRCKNFKKEDSCILLIEIPLTGEAYSNKKDEAYLRFGDENVKLNHEQRTILLDEKGKVSFELTKAEGASLEDLDKEVIEEYALILGTPGIEPEDLLMGRDLAFKEGKELTINMAGILLFGKNPEKWIERARVRILRYEGVSEKTGESLNLTKDIPISGPLPHQVRKSHEMLSGLLRDFTTLDSSGRFITQKEYPEFAWREGIVNAVVHRAYILRGADIQVKMFDDRLEIISPGGFPGFVTQANIKDTHYSRNPRIARVMADLGFVKELGEGVNRIIEEMKTAHLPEPLFIERGRSEVIVRLENNVSVRTLNGKVDLRQEIEQELVQSLSTNDQKIITFVINHGKITTQESEVLIGKHKMTALRSLRSLVDRGFLQRVGEKGPKVHYVLGPKIKPTKSGTAEDKPLQKRLFTS